MKPLRIRVSGEPHMAASWIAGNGYPRGLDGDDLADNYITVTIESGKEIVGYAWASWASTETLCVHMCLAPEARGRLPEVLPDLYRLASYLGAYHMVVVPEGSGRDARVLGRFLRRLDFEPTDTGYYIKEI